jgi:hypothetical protein
MLPVTDAIDGSEKHGAVPGELFLVVAGASVATVLAAGEHGLLPLQ